MKQIQINTNTSLNRYGVLYQAIAKLVPPQSSPRILVFGCSSGEEVQTIRKLWPEADIHGCDINEEVLETAQNTCTCSNIFFSDEESIAKNGPYDLIFANSVLCVHPCPWKEIPSKFSFDYFNEMCEMLDANLADDGILMLNNTNYFFQETSVFSKYQPMIVDRSWVNGFVSKLFKDGSPAALPTTKNNVLQEYRLAKVLPDLHWMQASLFLKNAESKNVLQINSGMPMKYELLEEATCSFFTNVAFERIYRNYEVNERVLINGQEFYRKSLFVTDYIRRFWKLHGVYYMPVPPQDQ